MIFSAYLFAFAVTSSAFRVPEDAIPSHTVSHPSIHNQNGRGVIKPIGEEKSLRESFPGKCPAKCTLSLQESGKALWCTCADEKDLECPGNCSLGFDGDISAISRICACPLK